MADPHDTLAIFAEVSVALAGFSGIAIAFGRRSLGGLTSNEMRRLSNLFAMSGFVLFSALLGMSALHFESASENVLARYGSLLVLIFGVPWLIYDWRKAIRLLAADENAVNTTLFYPFNIVAILILLLQLINTVALAESWPFFLALLMCTSFAFQQFILLVATGFRES